MSKLRRRPPASVKALEELQQRERDFGGLPPLSSDSRETLREIIARQLMSERLDSVIDGSSLAGTGNLQPVPEVASLLIPSELDAFDRDTELAIDTAIKSFRLDDSTQWSKLEYPVAVYELADLCTRIETTLAKYSARIRTSKIRVIANEPRYWHLEESPVVGTLATGQAIAFAQCDTTGHPLVLIENGLFKFSYMLAQIAALGLNELTSSQPLSSATIQLVSDICAAQTVIGTCLFVYPRRTPPAFKTMISAIYDAIMIFVIAHEYVHVINGDINASTAAPDHHAERAVEFVADSQGLRIAMTASAASPELDGAPVFGPAVYLAGLDLIRRAQAAFEQKPAPVLSDLTYPTPFERMTSLLQGLDNTKLGSVYEEPIRLASKAFKVVLSAWNLIMPAMTEASSELARFVPTGDESNYEIEMLHHEAVSMLWSRVQAHLKL
jgi:hypothetical protein